MSSIVGMMDMIAFVILSKMSLTVSANQLPTSIPVSIAVSNNDPKNPVILFHMFVTVSLTNVAAPVTASTTLL